MFTEKAFTLSKNTVKLFAKVTIGATGAPTMSVVDSMGVASVSRTSAGVYKITLQDSYPKLLNIDATQILASGLPAAPSFAVKTETVATLATPVINVCFSAAGVATEVDSGAVLLLEITLKNSSAI